LGLFRRNFLLKKPFLPLSYVFKISWNDYCFDPCAHVYINGQVPFNFDEPDNFQLGEQQDLSVPLSKNVTKLSMATDLDDGPETAVKG